MKPKLKTISDDDSNTLECVLWRIENHKDKLWDWYHSDEKNQRKNGFEHFIINDELINKLYQRAGEIICQKN